MRTRLRIRAELLKFLPEESIDGGASGDNGQVQANPVKERVQLEEVKSERREHRERRSRSGKRLRTPASSRLRSPRSRASDTD
jgi:hypothetical protein